MDNLAIINHIKTLKFPYKLDNEENVVLKQKFDKVVEDKETFFGELIPFSAYPDLDKFITKNDPIFGMEKKRLSKNEYDYIKILLLDNLVEDEDKFIVKYHECIYHTLFIEDSPDIINIINCFLTYKLNKIVKNLDKVFRNLLQNTIRDPNIYIHANHTTNVTDYELIYDDISIYLNILKNDISPPQMKYDFKIKEYLDNSNISKDELYKNFINKIDNSLVFKVNDTTKKRSYYIFKKIDFKNNDDLKNYFKVLKYINLIYNEDLTMDHIYNYNQDTKKVTETKKIYKDNQIKPGFKTKLLSAIIRYNKQNDDNFLSKDTYLKNKTTYFNYNTTIIFLYLRKLLQVIEEKLSKISNDVENIRVLKNLLLYNFINRLELVDNKDESCLDSLKEIIKIIFLEELKNYLQQEKIKKEIDDAIEAEQLRLEEEERKFRRLEQERQDIEIEERRIQYDAPASDINLLLRYLTDWSQKSVYEDTDDIIHYKDTNLTEISKALNISGFDDDVFKELLETKDTKEIIDMLIGEYYITYLVNDDTFSEVNKKIYDKILNKIAYHLIINEITIDFGGKIYLKDGTIPLSNTILIQILSLLNNYKDTMNIINKYYVFDITDTDSIKVEKRSIITKSIFYNKINNYWQSIYKELVNYIIMGINLLTKGTVQNYCLDNNIENDLILYNSNSHYFDEFLIALTINQDQIIINPYNTYTILEQAPSSYPFLNSLYIDNLGAPINYSLINDRGQPPSIIPFYITQRRPQYNFNIYDNPVFFNLKEYFKTQKQNSDLCINGIKVDDIIGDYINIDQNKYKILMFYCPINAPDLNNIQPWDCDFQSPYFGNFYENPIRYYDSHGNMNFNTSHTRTKMLSFSLTEPNGFTHTIDFTNSETAFQFAKLLKLRTILFHLKNVLQKVHKKVLCKGFIDQLKYIDNYPTLNGDRSSWITRNAGRLQGPDNDTDRVVNWYDPMSYDINKKIYKVTFDFTYGLRSTTKYNNPNYNIGTEDKPHNIPLPQMQNHNYFKNDKDYIYLFDEDKSEYNIGMILKELYKHCYNINKVVNLSNSNSFRVNREDGSKNPYLLNIKVMYMILFKKFTNLENTYFNRETLYDRIKQSREYYLIEHNANYDIDLHWSDNVYGTGLNLLGELSMILSEHLCQIADFINKEGYKAETHRKFPHIPLRYPQYMNIYKKFDIMKKQRYFANNLPGDNIILRLNGILAKYYYHGVLADQIERTYRLLILYKNLNGKNEILDDLAVKNR